MKCDCGRWVGDLSEYRTCCAASAAVRAFRMFGPEAGLGYVERVREWQGETEAGAVRALAREFATRRPDAG